MLTLYNNVQGSGDKSPRQYKNLRIMNIWLTHCGRVAQICVFNKVKLGTSASSP
jgi:hypothetical protein